MSRVEGSPKNPTHATHLSPTLHTTHTVITRLTRDSHVMRSYIRASIIQRIHTSLLFHTRHTLTPGSHPLRHPWKQACSNKRPMSFTLDITPKKTLHLSHRHRITSVGRRIDVHNRRSSIIFVLNLLFQVSGQIKKVNKLGNNKMDCARYMALSETVERSDPIIEWR